MHKYVRCCSSGTMTTFNTAVSASSTIAMNNAGLFTLTTPAIAGIHYMSLGLAFNMGDPSGSSELAALYDQYRLRKVELEFVPFWNEAFTAGSGGGNGLLTGVVSSAFDYDDNSAPAASNTGVLALQQYTSYRVDPLVQSMTNGRLKWTVNPRVAVAVYGGGVFSSYAVFDPPWIDCASAVVEHYGIKFVFEMLNPAAVACNLDFRVIAHYHLEYREVR